MHRLIAILLLVYVLVQVYCINLLSPTYDEPTFAAYGTTILKLQGEKDVHRFDSQLPITALNMLPRAVEQLFNGSLKRPDSRLDIIHGRYITLCTTILLALLVWQWSFALYGKKAALLSLLLFLLCPNFLAHGILVSSDIYACLFTTLLFYALWKFNQSARLKDFLAAAAALALAQVTKFSMIHLWLLFLFCLFVIRLQRGKDDKAFSSGRLIRLTLLALCMSWLVICTAHLFFGITRPLNSYHFVSSPFIQLQSALRGMGNRFFIPLPSGYLQSLDLVIQLNHLGGGRTGSTQGPFYILGQNSADGFWYYYFVALFFKLPLATLVLISAAIVFYAKRFRRAGFLRNEFFLLLPVLYYLVYLDFFYSTQIGIRHAMMVLPPLYIFCGFLYDRLGGKRRQYLLPGLLAYQFISVAAYFPHFLPYSNECIPDKKMAYRKMADTNLCYGENLYLAKQVLRAHPDIKFQPDSITDGQIMVEVNQLVGVDIAAMHRFDWLRTFIPENHIWSQYLIFRVTEKQADSLRRAR